MRSKRLRKRASDTRRASSTSRWPVMSEAIPVVPSAPPMPYPTAAELSAASQRPSAAFKALNFVAQVRRMFLLCEGSDGLYIIDQHAAAERVTFHRLRRAYDARDRLAAALAQLG